MSDVLKPCPFCGSDNLGSGGDDKIVGYWCKNCQAAGPNHYGKYEWEDRTTPTREQIMADERVQALVEAANVVIAKCESEHEAVTIFDQNALTAAVLDLTESP